MMAVAAVLGYLVGSVPTAGWLARTRGVDLRRDGSGNPGTANALRTSGPGLAALILVVEATKGYGAVWLGHVVADENGAITAGLGAVAGNVYNVWYRLAGGKGLGMTLGVLAGLWPWALVPIVVIIALGALLTRSAGIASLLAVAGLIAMSLVWQAMGWESGGLASPQQLPFVALGIGALISWKHWRDSPLSGRDPRSPREPASPGHR
jgi:acyl phosphate:glycerol-3-phosphate acyltransferase